MAFFEKLGKQANTMVETQKTNSSINTEKSNIKKIYTQIGEKLYASYDEKGEVDNEYMELCEQIKQSQEKIVELKDHLLEISGKRICSQCGKEIEKEAQFCPLCGGKKE